MATPMLRSLREQLPQVWIGVAGAAAYAGLLEGLDSFDQFIALPKGVRAQATRLRECRAEAIFLLPNSWSSALAARMAGIPRRVGRRAHGRSMILSDVLPPVGPARAMTEIYLDMLPALGLRRPSETPAAELRAAPHEPPSFIGLAPGAAFGASKQYPLDQLVVACHALSESQPLPIMLLGSPGEAALLSQVATALRTVGVEVRLPAPGDFSTAKRRIAECKVLLTMDSGARHIAVALGVPQVAIYGPTHPGWSAHGLDSTTILRRDELDCISCHKKECPIDHRCMTQIDSEQVARAVMGHLDPRAGAV